MGWEGSCDRTSQQCGLTGLPAVWGCSAMEWVAEGPMWTAPGVGLQLDAGQADHGWRGAPLGRASREGKVQPPAAGLPLGATVPRVEQLAPEASPMPLPWGPAPP